MSRPAWADRDKPLPYNRKDTGFPFRVSRPDLPDPAICAWCEKPVRFPIGEDMHELCIFEAIASRNITGPVSTEEIAWTWMVTPQAVNKMLRGIQRKHPAVFRELQRLLRQMAEVGGEVRR